jgi:hypothetical protein
MTRRFTAHLWREGDVWVAQCLEVDVASQGETEEEGSCQDVCVSVCVRGAYRS